MKKIILSILAVSSLLLMGACTTEEKKETNQTESTNTADFIFELEGIFPKNDRFQLFYSNDTNFKEENSVKVIVYGQTTMQKVVFKLPNDVKPQNLRLDLGSNPEQVSIAIKQFKLDFKGNVIEVADDKFRDYFPETSSVAFDNSKLVYNLIANTDGVFDPIIISSDQFKKDLNKIYNSLRESK